MHGNAALAHTTRNTLSVLRAIGKSGGGGVDVHPGAARPFCRGVVHAADIHGMCRYMLSGVLYVC